MDNTKITIENKCPVPLTPPKQQYVANTADNTRAALYGTISNESFSAPRNRSLHQRLHGRITDRMPAPIA